MTKKPASSMPEGEKSNGGEIENAVTKIGTHQAEMRRGIKKEIQVHPDNIVIQKRPEPKKRSKEQGLNTTEKLFVAEYCKDLNATAAYLRVKPDANKESARRVAHRLKLQPNVMAAINERIALKDEWADDARRRTIETLLNCLDAEHLDFMQVVERINEEGEIEFDLEVKDLRKVPKFKRMALSEIVIKKSKIPGKHGTITHKNVKIKPIDKKYILKLLIDVLGMKKDIDPDEKDRSQMEIAARNVNRRVTGILRGLKKAKGLRKMAKGDKGME